MYAAVEQLQESLSEWVREYSEERTHSGRYWYGKTPIQTFRDSIPAAKELLLRDNCAKGVPNGPRLTSNPDR